MRGLIWLALGLAMLWGGYWVVGSTFVERAATQWFADQRARGLTADSGDISVSGFPSRFDLTVSNPDLADPVAGWGYSAPFVQVLSMTWKPWHVIAALPNEQSIVVMGQLVDVRSSHMLGSLRLAPTADLPLREMRVEGREVSVSSDQGWTIGTKSLVLAVAPDATKPNELRLGLNVTDLAPDPKLTALVPDLGDLISKIYLDATLTLTAPLDRRAAETKPAVEGLTIADFQLIWGSLTLAAKGQASPDAAGFAAGQVDIRIENWRQIPALIVAMGLVRPEMGDAIARGIEALAREGADPEVLDLPLVFADGRMTLGPLPLGLAPKLR
jgi:hypothetical protein